MHMILFQEPTCHMNDMPFLYDMTTSFLYPYAFIQSINMLYMNEMILLYDMNTFLLYAHDSFSGTNMPHE